MNIKQRGIFTSIQNRAHMLKCFTTQLTRDLEAIELEETCKVRVRREYSDAEIQRLVVLNERLTFIEQVLKCEAEKESQLLKLRVADPSDVLYDYEIDVTMNFVLREDDSEYDEDDDNILTTRHFSVKHLDRDPEQEWGVGDDQDHKETCRKFPGVLNDVRHCYLFHDLYDHSYNLEMIELSFDQCLRVGQIWFDIEVKKQVSLNVDTGEAQYKESRQ